MVLAPVLLLLLLQLQSLPYHDVWLTWWLRLAILADLMLLWWLWRKVLAGDGGAARSKWVSALLYGAAAGASLVALAFAFVVATFPGEWGRAPWQSATDAVFRNPKLRWPKNTLQLAELNIWEAFKLDDPKKLDWKDHTIDLKERHLEGADFSGAKLGKADLRKAQLQGAYLFRAQLQGASLEEAQLQGASLRRVQLQGASLDWAQLQGASLWSAQLEGASLLKVKGQGAELESAQLGGASLIGAQLQGASLIRAQLQGASLDEAQLQGASLDRAKLRATRLESAFLWRSRWSDAEANQLFLRRWHWRAEAPPDNLLFGDVTPWTQQRYEALSKSLGEAIPPGESRDEALLGIKSLQCAKGVCDTPGDAKAAQELLEKASVDEVSYRRALAASLQELLCDGGADANQILRGVSRNHRLEDTGPNAPALIDFIMSDKCPVSAALTGDDKSRLLRIKQEAQKNYPPPAPAPAPVGPKPK